MNKFETFAALHKDFLLLPNAWDAGTARVMAQAGAKAIATSSAAVAWTHGYADGEAMPPELALQTIRAMVQATDLPVSADIEAGYAGDAALAGERAAQVIEAGAVGINIEDGTGAPDLLAAKIEAVKKTARAKNAGLWVNARVDVFLKQLVKGDGALPEAIRRAKLYAGAGADSVFVPGVVDPATLREIVQSVGVPLNVLAWPGLPDAAALKAIGVKRLSAGSGIALLAGDRIFATAKAFMAGGDSGTLSGSAISNAEINGMMRK